MLKLKEQVIERTETVIASGSCDGCDGALEFVFDKDSDAHDCPQFNDAMHVTFSSGYGESPHIDGSATMLLCLSCTDKLFALFPPIVEVVKSVQPMGSMGWRGYAVAATESSDRG